MNKENLRKKKQNQGITLVALVITIIVLLILAGITLSMVLGPNGIIERAKQAKEQTEEAQRQDEAQLADLEDYINGTIISEEGYGDGVNKPNLKAGMIPVYYDETSKVWKKADENNAEKQWYDYENKKWANIVTVSDDDKKLRDAEVGTEIPMDKITTFFVWIPRYAYSITRGYQQGNGETGRIDITFLKGNTNIGSDGNSYVTDYDESKLNPGDTTPKIVHPGFTIGNSQVRGIWVAKYEASGRNKEGIAVGNADSSMPYRPVKPDETSYVRILPSQISWRDITIGESEYQSMQMSTNTEKYGWTSAVNSHLITNNEWGAVAYLCYSDYGQVPKTNGAGSLVSNSHWYNLYTGAGAKGTNDEGNYSNFSEETYGYNTTLGVLASTTGNVYGIYDMAGGAWERVAAYWDNGNGNLNSYGKSTSNEGIKYFEGGVLNSKYSSLWNGYPVSQEEKENKIKVGEEEITQSSLWNWNKKEIGYNEARLRLTRANFENMGKYKGIGVNETTTSISYYAPYGTDSSNQTWGWFTEAKDTSTNTSQNLARTWNNDYVLIGYASLPFVMRGGYCNYGSSAGVLYSNITGGNANNNNGFRPALVF